MTTKRSILHEDKVDNKEEDQIDLDKEQKTQICHSIQESIDRSILTPAEEMNGVLLFVKIALLLSKTNEKGELEVLLLHAVPMIKKHLTAASKTTLHQWRSGQRRKNQSKV